jgi:RNA polymerase sigma-70 factor (ECF subfamily)
MEEGNDRKVDMNDPATGELLDRWMAGDMDAAEAVYHRYMKRLEKFATKWTRDADLAEEVAAEALQRALSAAREGKKVDRFTNWAFGIAQNIAVRHHRTSKKNAGMDDGLLSPEAGPQTVQLRSELGGLLDRAIAALPPSNREVIDLYRNEQLDRGEIAKRLGLKRETVDRRFARAYEQIRGEMRNHLTGVVVKNEVMTLASVEKLRPSFRKAFTIRHLENHSLEDTAEQLGIPIETCMTRLERAYQKLGCLPDDDFSVLREKYEKES